MKGSAHPSRISYIASLCVTSCLLICANAPASNGPETADDLSRKGNLYFGEKNYNMAIQYYDRAIQLEPDNASAWCNKGNALSATGQEQDALACVEKAFSLDPNFIPAFRVKASILWKLGRTANAKSCDESATAIELKWRDEAQHAYNSGLYNDALLLVSKLVYQNIRDCNIWNLAAICVEGNGQHAEALQYYDLALEFCPNEEVVLCNKASCLLQLQRYQEGLAPLGKALVVKPSSIRAWEMKASALESLGRADEARVAARKAASIRRWQTFEDYVRKSSAAIAIVSLCIAVPIVIGWGILRWRWLALVASLSVAVGFLSMLSWLNLRLEWMLARWFSLILFSIVIILVFFMSRWSEAWSFWWFHLPARLTLRWGYASARLDAALYLQGGGCNADVKALLRAFSDAEVCGTAFQILKSLSGSALPALKRALRHERETDRRLLLEEIIRSIESRILTPLLAMAHEKRAGNKSTEATK
jgi:tetratricopeptide (TPR) repeat protein